MLTGPGAWLRLSNDQTVQEDAEDWRYEKCFQAFPPRAKCFVLAALAVPASRDALVQHYWEDHSGWARSVEGEMWNPSRYWSPLVTLLWMDILFRIPFEASLLRGT